jgi:uncharacterized protein (TIGR03437 family)
LLHSSPTPVITPTWPTISAPFRHTPWRILPLLALSTNIFCANVTLQVSTETAPPSGFAQFKISPATPALVSVGSLSMTFDPAIFGPPQTVAAFSATGDQTGYASVQGQTVTATFSSLSASLGQLPQLPVFVVTVPVLAAARIGTTSPITIDPGQGPWLDPQGNKYDVTMNPGTFTVGGSVSIQSVTPGGGLLPTGTIVTIAGTGFDASTIVSIDGVSIQATHLVSSTQIDATLGGAMEMTGKHVHVASVDYFASLPAPTGNNGLLLILPQLPSPQYTAVSWSYPISTGLVQYYSCLQNPNPFPVTATYYFQNIESRVTTYPDIVIPPYGLLIEQNSKFTNDLGVIFMTVSAPIRMAEYRYVINLYGATAVPTIYPPPQLTIAPGRLGTGLSGFVWNWQIGTPPPVPQNQSVSAGFTANVSVSSGASEWLQASPTVLASGNVVLTLTPSVSQLGAGTYTGTVTITQQLPPRLAQFGPSTASFPVTMNVSSQASLNQPLINTSGALAFSMTQGDPTPAPQAIPLTTNGTAAAFTTSITGGTWLSVTPSSGTAPSMPTVSVNPAGLNPGVYNADINIQGPVNAVDVRIQLRIKSATPGPLSVSPTSLAFSLPNGSTATSQIQVVTIQNPNVIIATSVNSTWLHANTEDESVQVTTNATGLAPGTYQGTVTITSTLVNLVATVPVTLTVGPPPGPGQLTVTPSTLNITGPAGTFATANLNVNLISGVPYFSLQATASFQLGIEPPNPPPLYTSPSTYIAPAVFVVSVTAPLAGAYQGSITVAWNGGSATIPVAYYATASPTSPPIMTAIAGSGSGLQGSIAPGELISIFGEGLEGGTQVLINGIAAPVIYASPGQVNTIVPFEITGSPTATVQVVATGLSAGSWLVPSAPSAPSIFTASGTGIGPGAIVNADGSINTPSNPASRGTAIQIYATGGGQTSPASLTGSVAQSAANLTLPVTVTIGGTNAQVLYAGAAPGELAGVIQINAIVPPNASPGPRPVLINISGAPSQPGVTISIAP